MAEKRTHKVSSIILINLLLVLVYYFSGYISKAFADVSVIWPPTGIALAFFLLKGKRVLPAVFLGDFIVTLEIMGVGSPTSLLFSFIVGLQALLTVWIGRYLIHKYVGIHNPLIDNKSISLFLLVGGPVSMVLPSIITLATEYSLGLVTQDHLLFDLFIWWLGGAIGVIIFTPGTLIFLSEKKYYSRRFSVALPLILLFILDVLFFNYIKIKEQNNLTQVFEQQVQVQHNMTASIIDDWVDELQELRNFVENLQVIDEEFLSHYKRNKIEERTDEYAFSWVPKVSKAGRKTFEANNNVVITQEMSDGSVNLSETKAHYFPMQILSATKGIKVGFFEQLLGRDLSSNKLWNTALNRAAMHDKAEMITPFHLTDKKIKFIAIVLPVYNYLPMASDQNKQLKGFVMSILSDAVMINANIRAKAQNMTLKITELDGLIEQTEVTSTPDFEHTDTITEFYSPLDFTYFSADDFANNHTSLPVGLIFMVGLGITSLVGFLLLSVTGQTVQTQNIVDKKTHALNSKQELLSAVFNSVQEGIIACDKKGNLTVFNNAAEKIFENKLKGTPFAHWINSFNLLDVKGKPFLKEKEGFFDKFLNAKELQQAVEFSILTKGRKKILKATASLITHQKNEVRGAVISFQDITQNRHYINDLKKLSRAVELCPVSVFIMDADGTIEYINNKFTELTGYSLEEIKGKPPQLLSLEESHEEYDSLWKTVFSDHEWQGELYNQKKNGEKYWVKQVVAPIKNDQQQITHFVSLQEDITKEKKAKDVLFHQATHDDLTGLLNRRECEKRLEQVIKSSQEQNSKNVFCFLDLDEFKIINDTCGHIAGDHLLREVCKIFQGQLRQRDTLARLGGDEFGIIVEHCTIKQAEVLTKNICREVAAHPFFWEGQKFNVGVSIGLAMMDKVSTGSTSVINQADHACYVAKKSGRGQVCIFS